MGGKRRNKNKDKEGALNAPGVSKSKTGGGRAGAAGSDESDAESIATHVTLDDLESVAGEETGGTLEEIHSLGDNLSEYMENAVHKTAAIRVAALKNIALVLRRRYMVDALEKWKLTLIDLAEKALKRSEDEILLGAEIAALAALQFGDNLESETEGILIALRILVSDSTRCDAVRIACALSVGLIQYFCNEQTDSVIASLKCLRDVWTQCKVGAQSCALFAAALSSWCLLLRLAGHVISTIHLSSALQDESRLLVHIDEAALVEMRIAAGEAVAVLFELGMQLHGEEFRFANHAHLIAILNNLATDSLKFRAKRDRRVQRFTFRQILLLLKDGLPPSVSVKFGDEKLELRSCGTKLVYDQICQVIRGGINAHLKGNLLLREEFKLGPPVSALDSKISKSQRMLVHQAVDKARTQYRAGQRDKRSC